MCSIVILHIFSSCRLKLNDFYIIFRDFKSCCCCCKPKLLLVVHRFYFGDSIFFSFYNKLIVIVDCTRFIIGATARCPGSIHERSGASTLLSWSISPSYAIRSSSALGTKSGQESGSACSLCRGVCCEVVEFIDVAEVKHSAPEAARADRNNLRIPP